MRGFVLFGTVGLALFMTAGCDVPDRVTRLEKETQELKAEVAKDHAAASATANYDLQAKCSRDAKTWFTENWGKGDQDTIVLDHTNHYNKAMNKCFVSVEYHYHVAAGKGSWVNDITLWDVYENVKYGLFLENHTILLKPEYHSEDTVGVCEFLDKKCKTIDEFNQLVRPYLSN